MKRTPTLATSLLVILALLAGLGGCSSDDQTTAPTEQAPTLPDPAQLSVNLDFFADGAGLSGKAFGHQNFYNAYLRAVIVGATTDLVLAPPVAAFSLALHTVPNHQQDGSWIWVYTFVDGSDEAQVRLRGTLDGDAVIWEMRVSYGTVDQKLWFDGSTQNEGDTGHWTFYDIEQGGMACATLDWTNDGDFHQLTLAALSGVDAGDSLALARDGDDARIDFTDASAEATFFIRWNEADGTGSLQVPDYNNGEEACWDENQWDVDCTPAP